MSDSVRPHRRQPPRLPVPGLLQQEHWSGCHCLLFPGGARGKETSHSVRGAGSTPGAETSQGRARQPTSGLLPGEPPGQRSRRAPVHRVTESRTRLRTAHAAQRSQGSRREVARKPQLPGQTGRAVSQTATHPGAEVTALQGGAPSWPPYCFYSRGTRVATRGAALTRPVPVPRRPGPHTSDISSGTIPFGRFSLPQIFPLPQHPVLKLR